MRRFLVLAAVLVAASSAVASGSTDRRATRDGSHPLASAYASAPASKLRCVERRRRCILDLGRARSVDRVAVRRRGAWSERYVITTSTDARRFTLGARVETSASGWRTTRFRPRRARRVRVTFRGRVPRGAMANVRVRVPRPAAPMRAATPPAPAPGTAPPAPPPPAPAPAPAPPSTLPGVLDRPIDPAHQTALGFGDRSHWLQPWRAYLDTQPATRLRSALGINFNVSAADADAAARLLAASGFRRARVEINWGELDYDDESRLTTATHETKLAALRRHGIRPLILLNAHHGVPVPLRRLAARVTAPAAAGSRTLQLDAATADAVVPGRTGLNAFDDYKAAAILVTGVDAADRVTISKPLPRDLAAGTYAASTLRYQPFGPPRRADGSPNPDFEHTMQGWLRYVQTVTDTARRVLGSTEFDLEVWNEYSFGSDFLDIDRYYEPARFSSRVDDRVILERTLAWVRDPGRGLTRVRVGSGFSSQRPWDSGATVPPGLDAIGKHPYPQNRRFPAPLPNRPLDAAGRPSGFRDAGGAWQDGFAPAYAAYFPEYFLSGIQTETLVRDLSPITTSVYGTPHGRHTAPAGGTPPALWMTELNIDSDWAANLGAALTEGDVEHLRAKSTLRALTAYVNKGVEQIDFFAADDPSYSLIGSDFFSALHATGAYPGDAAGSETMAALRRLTAATADAAALDSQRSLSLLSVADHAGNTQFDGDGTPAHPPLYNRDVLAFLPFQVTDRRFVIPVYVMTRNLARLYRPAAPASDRTRFDLPPERYRLTIGGTQAERASVGASDPLTGETVPIDVISRSGGKLVVELPVTDSPRLLTVQDG